MLAGIAVMTRTRPTNRTTPTTNETHQLVARSTILLWFVLVGFAWLGGFISLANGVWSRVDQPTQILVAGISFIIGLLTFVPLEYYFRIHGFAVRGIVGLLLVVQIVLYVPAPTASLLWLPDVPVYILVCLTIYWFVSSISLPLTFAVGKVAFARRAQRYDVRRAWRQARELAVLCVGLFGLFGLRALIPLLVVPWILMVIITEVIFLSFIEPPMTR